MTEHGKKTIIVNLYGGPGTGKSTGAAYIFSRLKMLGIDAEYAAEYAKDKVWEEDRTVFDCQAYIFGKQAFRIYRLFGKVDVIVTDSPLLMSIVYGEPYLKGAVIGEYNRYGRYGDANCNFFLRRKKPYNANGRHQGEADAKSLDEKIETMLKETGVPYKEYDATEDGYNAIVLEIKRLLEERT